MTTSPIMKEILSCMLKNRAYLMIKNTAWGKKESTNLFDVTMGSYDGVETRELVGSFLLHQITHKHGENFGLYRDDGLGVLKATPREIEIIKKDLCLIFNNHGLKITIKANKKIVDFLDVTLNLSTQIYQPFTKPNNTPLYVHNKSNHPPKIIENIPAAIKKRLSEISSYEDSFQRAVPLLLRTFNYRSVNENIELSRYHNRSVYRSRLPFDNTCFYIFLVRFNKYIQNVVVLYFFSRLWS